jgi:hypothetical protein
MAASLLSFLALGANTALAGPLALVASTPRLDYFAERGAKVDVKRTEKFLDHLEEELGHELTTKARLVRHKTPVDMGAATGFYGSGVTLPLRNEVHSTESFHPHELVHLMASRLGDPGHLFHEGLAVILGDGGVVGRRHVRTVSREEALSRSFDAVSSAFKQNVANDHDYRLAGAFVAFLQERAGREGVRAFFAACPRSSAAPAAFQKTFGASIADMWSQWQESRPSRSTSAAD